MRETKDVRANVISVNTGEIRQISFNDKTLEQFISKIKRVFKKELLNPINIEFMFELEEDGSIVATFDSINDLITAIKKLV